jgi:hypothetical protein
MSCPCNCTNTLDFCNQPVCGTINFDVKTQMEGAYTMVIDYLDRQITLTETIETDQDIVFDISVLNENYQFTAELYDPLGAKILIRKDDIEYDCVKFKTVVNVSL